MQLDGIPDALNTKLRSYLALLVKWQKAINLVSPKTLDHAWQRHFLDSFQIIDLVPRETVVADLGSGAGFPGLVLAIVRPDVKVHLIESDERKSQFLKNVSRETGAPVTVHTGRVEKILSKLPVDVITARAFASLDAIFDYVEKSAASNPDLRMILLKGRDAAQEIEMAQKRYSFEVQTIASKTEEGAFVLVISKLHKII